MRNLCLPMVEAVPRGHDRWLATIRILPAAIDASRRMRQYGRHYKGQDGIYVGAAAVAGTDTEFGIFTGANQNLMPGDNPTKVCAEPVSEEKMVRYYGAAAPKIMTAQVVSGNVQPDTHSRVASATLHSCGIDRSRYQRNEFEYEEGRAGYVASDTIMFSVHPDLDVYEAYALHDLQTIHALGAVEELAVYADPGFKALRHADQAYLSAVEESLHAGFTPDYGALALSAITGQLPAASVESPLRLNP